MKNIKFIILILSFTVTFFSCATKPNFDGTGEIIGKVVDSKGKGLSNCSVTMDGLRKISTNGSGIFVFKNTSSGSHEIQAEKQDYSIEKRKIHFFDRQTFLEIKCKSTNETLKEAEDFIEQRDLENARIILKKIRRKPENSEILYFYEHLIEYLEKPNEKKLKNLANLAETGVEK